jgi:hypothetical protein
MINLLPYKEKKSIERIRGIRLIQTVIVGLIFIFIACLFLLFPTLININSRFSIASKQIDVLQKSGMVASDVDLASLNQRAQFSQSKLAIPETIQSTQYIGIVTSLVIDGVSINRFAVNSAKLLEISGVVENREILQKFIKALEDNESVSLVDSPVSNFVKSKNSDFKITISFK